MSSTYYCYKITPPQSPNYYTIEFCTQQEETPDKTLDNTLRVARQVFKLLSEEFARVKKEISQYCQKIKHELENNETLASQDFLDRHFMLNKFLKDEELKFEKISSLSAFRSLINDLEDPYTVERLYDDSTVAYKYCTHYGASTKPENALISFYQKEHKTFFLTYRIAKGGEVPTLPEAVHSFDLQTFEDYMQST